MYTDLEKECSKERYSQILDETQHIAEHELSLSSKGDDSDIWISIISQIVDIREKIVKTHVLSDWEDIYERYSIGAIGIEYFGEDDEMHRRLCDIFYGAVHYDDLNLTV